MGKPEPPTQQAAVIPFRVERDGRIEVLLIRRAAKSKWGIPKGMIDDGQAPADAAKQEAFEEAGAAGELSAQPVGSFVYEKRERPRQVQVFLLRVIQTMEDYPERELRVREWFPLEEAASVVKKPAVAELIRAVPQYIRRGPNGRIAFVRTLF